MALRDLNLLLRNRGEDAREIFAPRSLDAEARASIAAGMRDYVNSVRQSRAAVTEIAAREWVQLPPPPVNGDDFAAMLDARLTALRAWHARVMTAAGCTRRDAEYACYRARTRFEPRNTRGTNGRHKR